MQPLGLLMLTAPILAQTPSPTPRPAQPPTTVMLTTVMPTAAAPPTTVPPEAVPLTPGPVPVSPSVPTAAPGAAFLPPFTLPPNTTQTLLAVPPESLQPVTPGAQPLVLTADEAVVLAAQHNLGMMAALRELLAARSGVRSAAALSPPIFTIGPAFKMGGTTDGLLFQQPLELNGTRDARAGVARAQLRLSRAQAQVQLQALVYTIRLNFATLAQTQERLRLIRELRGIAEQFDAIARKQVALGARPGIERRQTAIEVARAKAQEALATGQEMSARAALNAYLGRAALDPIEARLDETLSGQTPPGDLAQAQSAALAVRGEVTAAEATRDIPLAQARLTRAQGRPDLAPSFRISQITPTYMDAGVGVVITVPLDYGTRRNQIRQQEQVASADAARITGAQAQVRLEVIQAATRLSAAEETLRGYDGSLLIEAKAILDAAQLGYRAGGTTLISVLEAQRVYRTILSERLDALTQAGFARAELERASGFIPPAVLDRLKSELDRRN